MTSDNPAAALCVTHHASRWRQGDGRWAEQRRFLGHSSFIPSFLLFIAVYSSCVFPLFLFYFFSLIVSLCWMVFRVLSRRVSRWRQGGWPEGRTAVFPRLWLFHFLISSLYRGFSLLYSSFVFFNLCFIIHARFR